MRRSPFLLGLLLLPAAPALAQSAPAAPAIQPKVEAPAERKICRREEGVGSRLNRKVCLTREQWAGRARAEAAARDRNGDPSESED
ncbi:hypothetical protein GGQ97_002024 [Sphingomonas kaistensis]|uniref:Uncharacterized protein n=1 Tax=Sphingomonas kaistensis TaxID=298708 RepID=A0A7X6BHL4_9SPHN|nr:hypothetical protein [Sphingomonas kaistensis]NJC06231.1 hypothetical protein [Sphingomonas kaistensis]